MRVALYGRVSTQEQAEHGYSVGEQLERMRDYCNAMEWDIYKEYVDAGFSGANTNRPSLQRMIRDIKAGKIDKVLVYKLDRLSRSQKDTLELIEDVFLANGCDFVSMSENFDTSTPLGRAMIGILAVFAQLEREQIKERMLMGKEARAKEGLFPSGRSPIGYDYIDGKLVINQFERVQIERIFNEYLQGKSPKAIAKGLNEAGLTHKYGRWQADTIRYLLKRRTYTGVIKHHETYFEGEHDPIISQDLFDSVQKEIDRRSDEFRKRNRRTGKAQSYLGGFLICGHCGAKYSKYSQYDNKGKEYAYVYYKCNSRTKRSKHLIHDPNCKNKTWRMDDLDSLVFDEIRKLSMDESYISQLKDEAEDETPIIQSEIDSLDVQLTRLMDLYAVGQMPLEILQDRIYDLNDRKLRLETELESILSEREQRLTKKETLHLAESFGDVLDNGDMDDIRAVIGGLIDFIEIDGEDITIHWKFT